MSEMVGHEAWEFENRVNRLRAEVSEVPRLLGEVSDTMLSIGRRGLSLAPGSRRGVPMPGGRALVVLAPVAEHATVTDDLPHPVTVMREVADGVRVWMGERSVPGESLAAACSFVEDSARWIVAHEELATWVEEKLGPVLGLLRSLVGDTERSEPRTFSADELEAHMRGLLAERPAEYRLTPAQAEHFWPGIAERIKQHRRRARVKARDESARLTRAAGHRVDVEPVYALEPDELGRYLAAALAEFDRAKGHDRSPCASRNV